MSDVRKYVFEIIKKHYPNIDKKDVSFTQGHHHFVYIVKNEVTFRFLKIPGVIDHRSQKFLKILDEKLHLNLPISKIYIDNDLEIEYEVNKFIPGTSFYPAVAKSFTNTKLIAIAKQLGEYLSRLHSFPIEKARELQLDELNPYDFWEYMMENPSAFPKCKRLVYPVVSKDEKEWIEKLFKDFINLAKKKPLPLRVCHGDLWTYHIIVDPNKYTLSGLIDFWGRITDPANDFKPFEYYGKDFVHEVYKNYSLSIDEDFEKRRLFYTGHDEVFELARKLEEGDILKIEKQKQLLSTYIRSHS